MAIASVVICHLILFFLVKRSFTKGSLTKSTEQDAELTKYKREQQAILQTIVDALIIIDERGKITQINPSCSRLLGYSEEELLDMNVSKLMADNLAKHHDQYIQNYLDTGDAKIIGIGREVKARH